MNYTFSLGGIPLWLRERIETQGVITTISVLQSFATTATNAGDTVSAAVFNTYIDTLSASPADSVAFAIGEGRIGKDFI